jgi:hypothetical protein
MLHKVQAFPEIENRGLEKERRIEASLWEVRNRRGQRCGPHRVPPFENREGLGTRSRCAKRRVSPHPPVVLHDVLHDD